MSKHTAGPWKWKGEDYRGDWGYQILVGAQGECMMHKRLSEQMYDAWKVGGTGWGEDEIKSWMDQAEHLEHKIDQLMDFLGSHGWIIQESFTAFQAVKARLNEPR